MTVKTYMHTENQDALREIQCFSRIKSIHLYTSNFFNWSTARYCKPGTYWADVAEVKSSGITVLFYTTLFPLVCINTCRYLNSKHFLESRKKQEKRKRNSCLVEFLGRICRKYWIQNFLKIDETTSRGYRSFQQGHKNCLI